VSERAGAAEDDVGGDAGAAGATGDRGYRYHPSMVVLPDFLEEFEAAERTGVGSGNPAHAHTAGYTHSDAYSDTYTDETLQHAARTAQLLSSADWQAARRDEETVRLFADDEELQASTSRADSAAAAVTSGGHQDSVGSGGVAVRAGMVSGMLSDDEEIYLDVEEAGGALTQESEALEPRDPSDAADASLELADAADAKDDANIFSVTVSRCREWRSSRSAKVVCAALSILVLALVATLSR